MADPRKLKSRNVDDYIKNVDEKVLKEQGRPVMFVVAALVVVGIGMAAFAYAGTHKQPEKTYDELTASRSKQVKVEETKADSGEKTSIFGFFTNKKDKKSKEIDRTTPMYTATPSDDIVSADPLSGSVQLGAYMFTLPCKLAAFTDVGIEPIGWTEKSNAPFSTDMVLTKNLGRAILIRYDEHSVYEAYLFDREDVVLSDATVVSLSQSTSNKYFDAQAQPLFAPGGVHIGSADADVDAYYGQFENYKISPKIGTHILNGPIKLDGSKNNLIYMTSDTDLNELSSVRVYKNY